MAKNITKNITSDASTPIDAAAVPTEDWTVEQLLQHHFSKLIKLVDDEETKVLKRLEEQFSSDEGACYELCKENAPTTHNRDTTATPHQLAFRVVLTGGPHAPHTVVLHAQHDLPCMVGRSKGKKFRDNGLSLFKDGEVSTTHAHFLFDGAALYFVDIGSTNGSYMLKDDGTPVELPPDEPFQIFQGAVILCGCTKMRIELEIL